MSKHAVVTGGAEGIGRAIVESLVQQGYLCSVFDINVDTLKQLKHDLPDVNIFHVDASNEHQVSEAVLSCQKQQAITTLINNAGFIHNQPLVNLLNQTTHSQADWHNVMNANLNTTFTTGSLVAKEMLSARTKGNIINISSICALGNPGQSAYSAAKAGVNALTKTWAQELGPLGIRCNAIAPGFIDNAATHRALDESKIDNLKSEVPLKNLGQQQDIVATVNFILNNDYLNGSIITVDGGLTA